MCTLQAAPLNRDFGPSHLHPLSAIREVPEVVETLLSTDDQSTRVKCSLSTRTFLKEAVTMSQNGSPTMVVSQPSPSPPKGLAPQPPHDRPSATVDRSADRVDSSPSRHCGAGATDSSQTSSQAADPSSPTTITNGDSGHPEADEVEDQFLVELRQRPKDRPPLRHAQSELVGDDRGRRHSQIMVDTYNSAYQLLQTELEKAHKELQLRDEESEKLCMLRQQMEKELTELTASLFEEANNMVQDANIKRMAAEKLLAEANQKIEVLQAEVGALKQLVLTSTPSSPNKHLHPQINDPPKEKKSSKPFWKTHRRSTSHHEFTKDARQMVEEQQEQNQTKAKEMDTVCFEAFVAWRANEPTLDPSSPFLSRMLSEDIQPCLNFPNQKLARAVQECVAKNTLMMEPIPSDSSYPRQCSLTECKNLCNFKIRLDDDETRCYPISQLCRNRIAAVCNFYTYLRYITQGLVKTDDKEAYNNIMHLRKQMALARLGFA